MIFSTLEDEWVPHCLVLPYPDVRKSLPVRGWTERGMVLKEEWEGTTKLRLLEREKGGLTIPSGSISAVLCVRGPHYAHCQLGPMLPSKINYQCPC